MPLTRYCAKLEWIAYFKQECELCAKSFDFHKSFLTNCSGELYGELTRTSVFEMATSQRDREQAILLEKFDARHSWSLNSPGNAGVNPCHIAAIFNLGW